MFDMESADGFPPLRVRSHGMIEVSTKAESRLIHTLLKCLNPHHIDILFESSSQFTETAVPGGSIAV
jgi:hypothetical protein